MHCLDQDFPFNRFDLCSGHTMGIRQSILRGHFWLTNFYKLRFILKSNIYLLSVNINDEIFERNKFSSWPVASWWKKIPVDETNFQLMKTISSWSGRCAASRNHEKVNLLFFIFKLQTNSQQQNLLSEELPPAFWHQLSALSRFEAVF